MHFRRPKKAHNKGGPQNKEAQNKGPGTVFLMTFLNHERNHELIRVRKYARIFFISFGHVYQIGVKIEKNIIYMREKNAQLQG